LGIYRKWWEFDDGDGVPETEEIYWEAYLSSFDNISLNDDKPSIVFSIGCKTAFPEYERNLGKSLLVNGSVAYIGATGNTWLRAGWENETSGGCQSIEYYFFEYLMNQNQTCAEALYNSKMFYWNYFDWGGWTVFQNLYDFCLYGDPALSLKTYENQKPDTPIIDGPTTCKEGVSYNFIFNATDPDGDDIWYNICWGDKEIIYIYGPYQSGEEINLSYTWTDKGTYIINCWASDIFDERSDVATLEVTIPRNKSFNFYLHYWLSNLFPGAFTKLLYLLGFL
ncbi:MAG: hypothetical protein JSU91_07065, partial [Thermoplasmatales archaeon]